MHRLLFTILFLFLVIPARAQEYLWPTDAGNFLSSTFGETRAAHFHAGLDIKTWGREGYQVFATRSGIVHRLQVTERGYGNAVYLKHADGSYSVYAHLQRFNDEFQAYVDSVRLIDHSFETELYLDSLKWQVEKGQVIGYTGSTGVGPPHLHFELRDSLENPFNALSTNLSVQDGISPIITFLIVEPVTADSRINGKAYAQTFSRTRTGDGKYDFGEIEISGKVGLAVNVYDMADKVYNKYAVYELSLLHEGDTLFYQKLDTFSYAQEGSNMFLDRITPFGSTNRGHQRLYSKDGSVIPFHKISGGFSLIEASKEAKTYQIVAKDFFGNASVAEVTISGQESSSEGKPDLSWPPDNWYWHENWASPDLENTIDLIDFNLGFYWDEDQRIVPLNEGNAHLFARIFPDSLQEITYPDRNLLLRFGPGSIFDTLTIAASYRLEDDLIKISVQPGMLPPKAEYKIEFYMGEEFRFNPDWKYNLYRVSNGGRLRFVKSKLTGRTIHAWTSDFGEFIIAADNESPDIYDFRIEQTDYGWWQGIVNVSDPLSGIDSETAEFWINDVKGIPIYDYEEQALYYHLPDFQPKTSNTALIHLKDKAGNLKIIGFKE